MCSRLSGLHKGSPGGFGVEKNRLPLSAIEHWTHQPVVYSIPHMGENRIFSHKSTNTLIVLCSMVISLLFGNTRIIGKIMHAILHFFYLE
jgi:hypothetical protein